MPCLTHVWGRIEDDGYQYCKKCGKAFRPEAAGCDHKWGDVDGRGYQTCERCGVGKNVGVPQCQHEWGDTDADGVQTCRVCNYSERLAPRECEHQWGNVKDGRQACTVCGKAREVAEGCQHKWRTLDRHNITNGVGSTTSLVYMMKCEKCGNIKQERVNANN